MVKKEIGIREWAFVSPWDGYSAPEIRQLHLLGLCNHPKYPYESCGKIRSSYIVKIDHAARIVETCNSIYHLEGPPDPKWTREMTLLGRYEEFKQIIEG